MYTQFAKCCCNAPPLTPTTITIQVYYQLAKRHAIAQTFIGTSLPSEPCGVNIVSSTVEAECIPGSPDTYGYQTPGNTFPLQGALSWNCTYSETNGSTPSALCLQTGVSWLSSKRTGLSEAEGFLRINQLITFTKTTTTVQNLTTAVYWWNGTAYVNSGVSTGIKWNRETYALLDGAFIYKQYVNAVPAGQNCRACSTATGSNLTKTGLSVVFNQQAVYVNGLSFLVTLAAGQTGVWTIAVSAGSLVIKQNGTTIIAYALSAYTIGQLVTAINALAYANATMGNMGAAGGVIGLSPASQVQSMITTTLTTGGVNVFVRKPGDPWETWQVSQRPSYTFGGTASWNTVTMSDLWTGAAGTYQQFSEGFESYIPAGQEEDWLNGGFGNPFVPFAQATIGTVTANPANCSLPPVEADANCNCAGCGGGTTASAYAWDVTNNGYVRPYTGVTAQYSWWSCKTYATSAAMVCDIHYLGTDCTYGLRALEMCPNVSLNYCLNAQLKKCCFETATGQGKGFRYQWSLRRY